MFIGYYRTMRQLGYECTKDKQLMDSYKRKTSSLNLKVIFLIVFNVFSFKTNFQEVYKLPNNSPKKLYYTNELSLSQITGGSQSESEKKINENLKDINYIGKLKNNISNNSRSFNKSLMDIYNKVIDSCLNFFLTNPGGRAFLQRFFESSPLPDDAPNLQLRTKQLALKNPENTKILFADAAIVPVNPRYLIVHGFGLRIPNVRGTNDVFKTKTDVISEALNTPVANFKTTCEFLYRSKSEVEYRSRFWRVARDTTVVNALCINDAGAFLSGVYASDVAEKYMKEMIDRELFPNEIEKLNMQIYKQVAKSKNISPDVVEGTGLFRDFVREEDKVDLCKNPKNKRPIWEEEKYNNKLTNKDSYQQLPKYII